MKLQFRCARCKVFTAEDQLQRLLIQGKSRRYCAICYKWLVFMDPRP